MPPSGLRPPHRALARSPTHPERHSGHRTVAPERWAKTKPIECRRHRKSIRQTAGISVPRNPMEVSQTRPPRKSKSQSQVAQSKRLPKEKSSHRFTHFEICIRKATATQNFRMIRTNQKKIESDHRAFRQGRTTTQRKEGGLSHRDDPSAALTSPPRSGVPPWAPS